jgi:hypothetical protein
LNKLERGIPVLPAYRHPLSAIRIAGGHARLVGVEDLEIGDQPVRGAGEAVHDGGGVL